jgi:hypothetical protein
MIKNSYEEEDEVARVAESLGLPYRVDISPELASQIKPNEFLSGLGIRYLERIESILGILEGNRRSDSPPKDQVIPYNLVKGPFIKEELVSIRAELSDDGGGKVLKLTAILEKE